MTEWKEAMRLWLLAGDEDIMEKPLNGAAPTADEFFDTLKLYMGKATADWTSLSTNEHYYHDVDGYGWMVWEKYLYLAIPHYDTYERHEGKWAKHETLVEAVEEIQHNAWTADEDWEELKKDIDNYLSKQ